MSTWTIDAGHSSVEYRTSFRSLDDRRDFGVTRNAAMDTGGAYLGERVQISLSIRAILQ